MRTAEPGPKPIDNFELAVFLPINTQNRNDLRALGCAVYMPSVANDPEYPGVAPLSAGERNQLLTGVRTVEQIEENASHSGDAVFKAAMEAQALNCSVKWATSQDPETPVYYGGSLNMRSVGVGRTNGWIAAHNNAGLIYFQCNWEPVGDETENNHLILDSCSDEIANLLPALGTDVTDIGVIGLITMLGYVHVPG